MKKTMGRALPNFTLFNQFFADLGDEFTPVICSENDRERYLNELVLLGGSPAHEFRQLRDDLRLTAIVREVRKYPVSRTFVRFEFRRMTSRCVWSEPIQLMAVFDDGFKLIAYTVLQGRGKLEDGLIFKMTKKQYDWSEYETTDDPISALTLLDSEDAPEVAIIDKATDEPIAYVYGGKGPRGCGFDIEWYLACAPWLLAVSNVGFAEVENLVFALKDGGIKAFEDAIAWNQFDFDASYREHGVEFNIDCELTRFLERARRAGDQMIVKTIQAVGVHGAPVDAPYCLRVSPGRSGSLQSDIFDKSCEENIGQDVRSKLLAYLAIRGRIRASNNNLGYQFHFGFGVKTDYELAIHWHEIGARAGDAYNMLSLGKIYSEKNSPVWDGPLAIKWFEKAINKGDTWAMGELGHCILCGKCVEQNFERAVELLEKAVAANPNRESFAKDLERARCREGCE